MAYKPVKIVALENEAARLEKMEAKIVKRLAEIRAELNEIESGKKSKKETI